MAMQMAVFALGSLLMLVAVLGGGFEVKELKVPKVGRSSRLSACVCGLLFIFLGVYLDRSAAAAPAAAPPPAAPQQLQTSTAESRQQAQRPESQTSRQTRSAKPKSEPRNQAIGASSKTSKAAHWEEKPRAWINRLKGKKAAQ